MNDHTIVDAPAICVGPGKFYGGRDYPNDIKYDDAARLIEPGEWVLLKMKKKDGVPMAIGATKMEPGLKTIKHEGRLYLDVTVVFSKNDLYSEDMDDYIYVPQTANVDEFEFDVIYALLVTWMDPAERNYCAQKQGSGSKARWKLAVNMSADGSTKGLPVSRMGYSFVAQKQMSTLMGLVVGQDSNDRRRFYVWCPGCPLHYDGIVVEDTKFPLKIGKFILFRIDRREYNDVFMRRDPRHFYIVNYDGVTKPPCEVYVTNVVGDDRKQKNIIKMSVVDFVKRSSEMTRVSDGNVNGFIFTHNKIHLSDDKGKMNAVPEGHMCNLMIIRQKPTEPWMTQWRVHEVISVRRPPPPKRAVEAPNLLAERMNRLSVDTKERPVVPAQVSRSKSVEVERRVLENALSTPSCPPPPPVVPAAPPAHSIVLPPEVAAPAAPAATTTGGQFDDLDHDEHIAFVEAYCPRNEAVYLWIVDDPQQAVIWGCKGKKKPPVGTFLRGYFKRQADGRLFVNMEDYENCGTPAYIKVFDRSGHAIVRTEIMSEKTAKGEVVWKSKFLGVVEDTQNNMPRKVLDRERFVVQIGKRKQQDRDFVWTIEMDVSKEHMGAGSALSSPIPARGVAGGPITPVRKTQLLRSPTSRSANGGGGGVMMEERTARRPPLSPPTQPSPGFDSSRKTSIEEEQLQLQLQLGVRQPEMDNLQQLQHQPPHPDGVNRENGNGDHRVDGENGANIEDDHRYHVNDEWNEDTRLAREELDPCIALVETFANGLHGLFGDNQVLDIFGHHLDPSGFARLMQLSGKH
ncbi:hypothetical protein PFISCL1PPCAC_16246 [Pristionchus fissidentatus]|uniref:Uncharacterized protein n=1 Tax=Pristionchus fissidentatus TaxID=1538716 RepID=A0AAV5VZ93_9BILA|nr:hypothetical protein PFISCL1PPCAC_16246 [Pristionchus fissidentatus]